MSTSATAVATTSPQDQLLERLSDPRTVDALNRLLDRLDVIAFTAEALEGFLRRAEVVSDAVAQGLEDLRRIGGGESGAGELLARLPQVAHAGAQLADLMERPEIDRLLRSGLLETLAEPRTIEGIKALAGRLELATFVLDALDGFLRRGDAVVDAMTEGAEDLRQASPLIDGEQLRKVANGLPSLVEAGSLLADAGMFDPKTITVLGRLGQAVAGAHQDLEKGTAASVRPLGLFGLLKVLREPEMQRVLNLALRVAERYGKGLA